MSKNGKVKLGQIQGKQFMKEAIMRWIAEQRREIIDPDDEGLDCSDLDKLYEEGLELDEGQQSRLQLFCELETFIEGVIIEAAGKKIG